MTGNSSPIDRIVARFGGQNAMARALGIRQSVVWGWVQKGRIPYDRISVVVAAARKLEPPLVLTESDFIVLAEVA